MAKMKKDKPTVQPETDMEQATGSETAEAVPGETAEAAMEDAGSVTLSAEEFKTAQEEIAKLRREKDETVQLLQRNQADFDNYRRRNASARADSYEEGKRDCIKALLPVLDNFERALDNEQAGDEAWREGVRLVNRQLHDLLQKQGLSEIEADGAFDPNMHEAVMQEKAEGSESGDILAVLQKGYRVGDKIIRHSMVKVAE